MAALTSDRNTPSRDGRVFTDPVSAGVKIYAGSLVVLDAAGNAAPGSTATGLKARGIAQEQVDNTAGAAGDQTITSVNGVWKLANDGSISRADIGGTAYIVDDQTVANNDATGSHSLLSGMPRTLSLACSHAPRSTRRGVTCNLVCGAFQLGLRCTKRRPMRASK